MEYLEIKWPSPVIPIIRRLKQENCHLRLAWTRARCCLKTTGRKERKKKSKKLNDSQLQE